MHELWFKEISIDLLGSYVENFTLEPHIGYHHIPFREPVKVRLENCFSKPVFKRQAGSVIAFYINAYTHFVKIGSSRLNYVTSRMFTQAPLVGAVSTIIVVKENETDIETVENLVVKRISGDLYLDLKIGTKRNVEQLKGYIDRLLNVTTIEDLNVKNLVTKTKEIGEKCWLTLKEMGGGFEVVSLPNVFVFTTGVDRLDLEVLNTTISGSRKVVYGIKHLRVDKKQRYGELIVLKNGLCILKVKERTFIDFCDKLCFNFCFETVD